MDILAVGDIINFMATGGVTTYQPASGVEIMILRVMVNATITEAGTTDGINKAVDYYGAAVPYVYMVPKLGITNTMYYTMSTGSNRGFSGIQIK